MYPYGPATPPPEDKKPKQEEPAEAAESASDETDVDVLDDPVIRWRATKLVDYGMTPWQARALAVDLHVDVHYVIHRLILRGCDPFTAFDIASGEHA